MKRKADSITLFSYRAVLVCVYRLDLGVEMLVVQMVVEVCLGLTAQLLAQVGIIDESAHGLCQLVGIAWRNEQAIATTTGCPCDIYS